MSPQFNNMDELLSYLESLENRIRTLEGENVALQGRNESLTQSVKQLGGDARTKLPKTNLLAPGFLKRAFAVWGHYFVAQLMISIPLTCILVIITYLLMQQGILDLPILSTP